MNILIKNWCSVTGEYRKYIDVDLLNNINRYNPIRTENSLSFKYTVKNGNTVFIKFSPIKPGFKLVDEGILRRICKVNHPNVSRLLDIALVPGNSEHFPNNVLTISKYIHPQSLIAVILNLHKNRKSFDSFIIKLLSGFKELHSKGLLHRDVNIYNLMFKLHRNEVLPVISDINIFSPDNSSSIFCSPEFLAPEVDSYFMYGVRSEIWAVGVLLYFLSTFNFPFESRLDGKESQEVIDSVRNHQIDLKSNILPAPYGEIINSMMNKNPSRRPEDLAKFSALLSSSGKKEDRHF